MLLISVIWTFALFFVLNVVGDVTEPCKCQDSSLLTCGGFNHITLECEENLQTPCYICQDQKQCQSECVECGNLYPNPVPDSGLLSAVACALPTDELWANVSHSDFYSYFRCRCLNGCADPCNGFEDMLCPSIWADEKAFCDDFQGETSCSEICHGGLRILGHKEAQTLEFCSDRNTHWHEYPYSECCPCGGHWMRWSALGVLILLPIMFRMFVYVYRIMCKTSPPEKVATQEEIFSESGGIFSESGGPESSHFLDKPEISLASVDGEAGRGSNLKPSWARKHTLEKLVLVREHALESHAVHRSLEVTTGILFFISLYIPLPFYLIVSIVNCCCYGASVRERKRSMLVEPLNSPDGEITENSTSRGVFTVPCATEPWQDFLLYFRKTIVSLFASEPSEKGLSFCNRLCIIIIHQTMVAMMFSEFFWDRYFKRSQTSRIEDIGPLFGYIFLTVFFAIDFAYRPNSESPDELLLHNQNFYVESKDEKTPVEKPLWDIVDQHNKLADENALEYTHICENTWHDLASSGYASIPFFFRILVDNKFFGSNTYSMLLLVPWVFNKIFVQIILVLGSRLIVKMRAQMLRAYYFSGMTIRKTSSAIYVDFSISKNLVSWVIYRDYLLARGKKENALNEFALSYLCLSAFVPTSMAIFCGFAGHGMSGEGDTLVNPLFWGCAYISGIMWYYIFSLLYLGRRFRVCQERQLNHLARQNFIITTEVSDWIKNKKFGDHYLKGDSDDVLRKGVSIESVSNLVEHQPLVPRVFSLRLDNTAVFAISVLSSIVPAAAKFLLTLWGFIAD